MNPTVRNTVIVILVIVVVVGLIFAFKNSNTLTTDQAGTTSTGIDSSNSSGSNQPGGATAGSNTGLNIDSNEVLAQVMNSALLRIPQTGVDVALTNGKGTYKEGAVEGSVALGNIVGKTRTESGYDVFVQLSFAKKGTSAVQQYVAVFSATPQAVVFSSAISVGDRVIVRGVAATEDSNSPGVHPSNTSIMNSEFGYIATINYLDRKNGESATTTPTVEKTLATHVKNHIITK